MLNVLKKFAIFNKSLANFQKKIKNVNLEQCKGVHCVDLGKSFPTQILFSVLKKMGLQSCAKECIVLISTRAFKRIFFCKIWLRYSRERALQR